MKKDLRWTSEKRKDKERQLVSEALKSEVNDFNYRILEG